MSNAADMLFDPTLKGEDPTEKLRTEFRVEAFNPTARPARRLQFGVRLSW